MRLISKYNEFINEEKLRLTAELIRKMREDDDEREAKLNQKANGSKTGLLRPKQIKILFDKIIISVYVTNKYTEKGKSIPINTFYKKVKNHLNDLNVKKMGNNLVFEMDGDDNTYLVDINIDIWNSFFNDWNNYSIIKYKK